jgi:hypothetical protein
VSVFGMIVSVLLSIVFAFARAVFRLVVLRGRGEAAKDVELLQERSFGLSCANLQLKSVAAAQSAGQAPGLRKMLWDPVISVADRVCVVAAIHDHRHEWGRSREREL